MVCIMLYLSMMGLFIFRSFCFPLSRCSIFSFEDHDLFCNKTYTCVPALTGIITTAEPFFFVFSEQSWILFVISCCENYGILSQCCEPLIPLVTRDSFMAEISFWDLFSFSYALILEDSYEWYKHPYHGSFPEIENIKTIFIPNPNYM